MAVTHDMAHSFDIVGALPVKTDEGANLIAPRARHRQASRCGIKKEVRGPLWPLADVVIPRRYHSFAGRPRSKSTRSGGSAAAAESASVPPQASRAR
jgi:hypothetical protein